VVVRCAAVDLRSARAEMRGLRIARTTETLVQGLSLDPWASEQGHERREPSLGGI
jgi:hypothetical protein